MPIRIRESEGEDMTIELARQIVWKHALRLEIKGMRRRGRSVYSIIKQQLGFKGNRQRVLEQLERHIERQTSSAE